MGNALTGIRVVDLTNNQAADYGPAWSPDGTKIAFASDRDQYVEIFTMDSLSGANQASLTQGAASSQPSWSKG